MRFQIRETYYNKAGKKCFIPYSDIYPTRAAAVAQVFEFMRSDQHIIALKDSNRETTAEMQTCTYAVMPVPGIFDSRLNNNLSILL